MSNNKLATIAGLMLGGLGLSLTAQAVPINYAATISNGVSVTGSTSQSAGNESNPVGAVYYRFDAVSGNNVTVNGDRLEGAFDMAFWVFQGLFSNTNAFGSNFSAGDAGFIAFGDDDTGPNIPGPFGDPLVSFVAPVTGSYTIAVTNFDSSGRAPYDFRLTVTGLTTPTGVPEPASLALAAAGLLGMSMIRRRRIKS